MNRIGLLAIAFFSMAAEAQAQPGFGIAYGGYLPLGGSLIREYGGVNGAIVAYPVLEKWQGGAMTVAARFDERLFSRFSIEAKAMYSPGRVSTRDSTNDVADRPAHMFAYSLRVPIELTAPKSPFVVTFSPGVALQQRGGVAWNGVAGTSNAAGVLALGFGGLLGRRSKWSSRIEIEDYLSSVSYSYSKWNPTSSLFHQDIMISVGLDYSFKRPPSYRRQR